MIKSILILGRFQPFHLGHLSLIKRYSQAGFFIKIGIGSSENKISQKNPLTKNERKEIIKKSMNEEKIKNYKIFYIPDINNDKKYVKHVIKIIGEFQTIITGNPHVLRLFLKYKSKNPWNIETFKEDISRPGGKITSSRIRKKWKKKPDKAGLHFSTYLYLKKINFSERLKKFKAFE